LGGSRKKQHDQGEPLSDQPHLAQPSTEGFRVTHRHRALTPESPVVLVPRDTGYERLCALAKAARRNDLRLNPALALDWDFAAAVSKLNAHPMSWLLQWAGVKGRRPLWDGWLLIAAAQLAGTEPWTPFQRAGVGAVFIAILVLLYFASRRSEEWQLKQNIERCRRSSSFTIVT
jgi:hypothetical protein